MRWQAKDGEILSVRFFFFIFILFLGIGVPSQAAADDHGNNTGSASSISLNSSANGVIESGGDIDYFRVTTSGAGTLTAYTTGSTDTYGTLYSGNSLASNDDANGSTNFRIQYNIPAAGTYYVAVRHYSSSQTGSYSLRVDFVGDSIVQPPVVQPPSGSGDDHGNNTGSASSISLNSSANGVIESGGDIDYFRVTTSGAGTLTAYTTGSTDTYGTLYSGNSLASNDDANGSTNFRIQYNIPAAGTYYVAVRHYSSSQTGSYSLRVDFVGDSIVQPPVVQPPSGSGDDHGNNTGSASSISLNSSANGVIESGGDIDYFRVTTSGAGTLTAYTTGSTDTYGTLYSGNSLASNDDANGSTNFRIQYNIPAAGTYYVAVRHYSSSQTGSYSLRVDFVGDSIVQPPVVQPPSGSGDDHGNNTGSASSISLNSSANGVIESGGDIDYFRISVPRSGMIDIYSTGNTDTFGILYNISGSQIASNDDGNGTYGNNFHINQWIQESGTYYIAVRHYSSSQVGGYQLQVNFSLPSDAPTLQEPSDGTNNVPTSGGITFRWSAPSNATNYRIVISQNNSFSGFNESTMQCDGTCFTNDSPITTNQYVKPSLTLSGHTYYWRVRANGTGGASGWSSVSSFTTSGGVDISQYRYADYCRTIQGVNVLGAVDDYSFYKCQCTSYVAWRLNMRGVPFTNWYEGVHFSDAKTWDDNVAQTNGKVAIISNPQAGDIAVYNSGDSGHVAYVESINSNGTINISEYNWGSYNAPGQRSNLNRGLFNFLRFY
ncbi:CHAP domain-containing protein [Thiothrix subterranea]|uniref:CHAP domain-containing protein n=1 Tax=Thiothrix subterranea TaxID=2735563 RepID=UPI00192C45BE|nr:CHAP domain-containing protein [Thiothrix subterranea]QQZ30649.1 CHAP domain-containing protein [Thiothrix subterranea]